MAATGDPIVIHYDEDQTAEMVPGPVMELALIDCARLVEITDLNDMGRVEEAERLMLNFALETGVCYIDGEDLAAEIEFEQRKLRKVPGDDE